MGLRRDKYICKPEILQTTKTNHQIALSCCSQLETSILKLERIILNMQSSSRDGILCQIFGNIVLWERSSILCITFKEELNKNEQVEEE